MFPSSPLPEGLQYESHGGSNAYEQPEIYLVLEAGRQPDALEAVEGTPRVRRLRYKSSLVLKKVLKHFEAFIQPRIPLTPMGFCQRKWFECLKWC